MTRFDILDTAGEIVGGHRVTDYGEPEDNFGVIARLWSAYLGIDISDVDVSMLMVLFKAGRIKSGTATEDSFVDICGYAACGGEITAMKTLCKPRVIADIPISDRHVYDNVLERMEALISRHGCVSINAVRDVRGVPSVREELSIDYGWRTTNGVELRTENGKYYMHFPAAEYIGSDKHNN